MIEQLWSFVILLLVATSFAFLLWQLIRPWKKKKEGDTCDKCRPDDRQNETDQSR